MTPDRKRRRWWVWALAGTGGVLLLAAGAGYAALDRYASDIVIDALADADLPDPQLRVESVGLSESRLADVSLGDDDALTAEGVALEYDILDLADFDLSRLTIRLERPTLRMSVDEAGHVSLGSLDSLLRGGSQDSGPPFREIFLEDARLLITTPEGEAEVGVNGRIEALADGAFRLDAAVSAVGQLGGFQGTAAGTIGPGTAVDAVVTAHDLVLATPWATAEGGEGEIALRWTGDGLPQGRVDVTLRRLVVSPDVLPEQVGDESGLALENASVRGALADEDLSLAVSASDPEGENALSVALAFPQALTGGEATLTVDISTSGDRLLWLWHDARVGGGTLTASAEAAATLPPLPALLADPSALTAVTEGRVDAQWILSEASFPGLADGVSAIGEVGVTVREGIATLTAEAPLEFRLGRLDPTLLDGIAEADPAWQPILDRQFAGHVDVAIEGRANRPLSLTLARRDDGWTVRGDATVLVATRDGPIAAAELTGNATLGEAVAVAIDDLSLYAADIATPGGSVGVLEAAGRFAWRDGGPVFDLAGAASELALVDPQLSFPRLAIELAMSPETPGAGGVLAGPIAMTFADSGGAIDDVALTGLSGELSGRLVWDEGTARLIFTSNAVFRVENLDIDGDVVIPGPSIVQVLASETPVIEIDFRNPDGWSLRHRLDVAPLDIQGSIRMGDERIRAALRTRSLEMDGGYVDGSYAMRIDIAGATGTAPQRGWGFTGATVTIEYDDTDTQNMLTVQAAASELAAAETQGVFSRIGMRGRMLYGLDDVIRFNVRLFDQGNILIADVTASHDIDRNVGSASVEVQDLIFSPVVLQPGQISPLLEDFENVTGTVDVRGSVRWNGAAITPDLSLHITDMSGSYDDVEFTRMNTVVKLSSLNPLETPPGQLLSIATIDPGVPISDARITFSLQNGDTLAIEQATLTLAGGAVTAANQAIAFVGDEQRLHLTVTGVDLDALLALTELDNLEAQGTLDGGIPIVIVNGDVVIPEAWLSAREPGYIRYAADDLGAVRGANEGVDLMLDLLENFLYDELDLRLMRPVAGSMQVSFRILGRNPEVYGGVPIDLTLNVDGELEDVIRSSLEIYRVPDAIQDLIMDYGFEAATPPG
mgnify:CR=1 FL=1|jgi:hypothetical protein